MLMVDKKSKASLHTQLYEQIKTGILNGTIQPGARLQSSRKASEDLGVSRNTVEMAYDRLFSEGFITSKPRKGYYAEAFIPDAFHESRLAAIPETGGSANQSLQYDFHCGKLLLSELPCGQWQRLTGRCFNDYRESLIRQGSVFGEAGLRAQIQRYLHDYRNVHCMDAQIVVGAGTQFCLGIACQILKAEACGLSAAMEEPGYDQSRLTLQNNGFQVLPVGLDKYGLDADALDATDAKAVYVTPSHQFPAGIVMPMSRREKIAEWAARRNAFIIEDDYNCHFQHDQKPIPSIQSICEDRVIHIGSFSDLLFPCVRVSYMVVPLNLLKELHKRFAHYAPFVPFLVQKPLELFIGEGHLESLIRKAKKRQRQKRDALVEALKNEFGGSAGIFGQQAGLHVLVRPNWQITEDELIRRAAQAGVGVYPASGYRSRPENSESGTVLLNYGGMPLEYIPEAVALLRRAWREK